ncbi:hypothetical protein DFJ67_8489 [Asanoa ferruginea]|uniref:Uncharacterized protein n=1 Tax=Asanoa ferruginea TaxID=53367 RepID=A0A3E0A1L8_9ACTN|nr:hypothetical protein DFJ67_8489 [Asanoa ferruginea]
MPGRSFVSPRRGRRFPPRWGDPVPRATESSRHEALVVRRGRLGRRLHRRARRLGGDRAAGLPVAGRVVPADGLAPGRHRRWSPRRRVPARPVERAARLGRDRRGRRLLVHVSDNARPGVRRPVRRTGVRPGRGHHAGPGLGRGARLADRRGSGAGLGPPGGGRGDSLVGLCRGVHRRGQLRRPARCRGAARIPAQPVGGHPVGVPAAVRRSVDPGRHAAAAGAGARLGPDLAGLGTAAGRPPRPALAGARSGPVRRRGPDRLLRHRRSSGLGPRRHRRRLVPRGGATRLHAVGRWPARRRCGLPGPDPSGRGRGSAPARRRPARSPRRR